MATTAIPDRRLPEATSQTMLPFLPVKVLTSSYEIVIMISLRQNHLEVAVPERIPFTDEEIDDMRRMRRAGASLHEIARCFRTSATTILSYTRGIEPSVNGHKVEYTLTDLIYDWLPALPNEGLPLPRWIATWLRERAEMMTKSQKGDRSHG